MKTKIVITLITLIAAVLLSACAPQATPAAPTAAPLVASATPVAAAVERPAGCLGIPDKMVADLNCREVRFAVENAYLPFNYIALDTNQPGGWDYDTFNEICARLNCTPVYVEASWDTMIQSVADGQYDVAGDGITITPERAKMVAFSQGYIQIQQRLLVRKGETRFDSIETLATDPALTLGTQINTTNYETAVGYLPEARIKGFEQMPFAIQALLSEDVDAVIIDQVAGLGYQGENTETLDFVGPGISSDELGFAFPLGSDLVAPVNLALDAMMKDGTLKAINIKFFGPDFDLTAEQIK